MKPQAHAAVKECALRAHPWANTTRRFSPNPFSFGKKDANPSTIFCRAAACSYVTRKFVPRAHRRILRPANSDRDNRYFLPAILAQGEQKANPSLRGQNPGWSATRNWPPNPK